MIQRLRLEDLALLRTLGLYRRLRGRRYSALVRRLIQTQRY